MAFNRMSVQEIKDSIQNKLRTQFACEVVDATPEQLYQALALLKDEERTCITLQLIDGQPIDRISDITGMPQNTVKSHLRRGKEKLTDYLKKNGYDRT